MDGRGRAYFDWNATAPLRPEVRVAMSDVWEVFGNPSSVHAEGRAARALVEDARAQVARLVGAEPKNMIFTASGTEANVLALSPALESSRTKAHFGRLLVSAIEHPSVHDGGRFPQGMVEEIPVTATGQVDLAALGRRLAVLSQEERPPFVSVMLANNETGVIQPIAAVAEMVREVGGLLHVDAVQGPGRISCDINKLNVDLVTLSGHKIGGPKGVGALVRRDDSVHFAEPLLRGGGQERGLRAGTENVIGIIGFGAAAKAARESLEAEAIHMVGLRDRLESGLRALSPGTIVFGAEAERLPNTTLFTVPGMKAETAVIAFDLEGVAVSSGAACSSGKVQPSHVLAAMGVAPHVARGAVRVSLGRTTTESDVDRFLQAWIKLSQSLPKVSQGIAA